MSNQIERLRYYDGEYLRSYDFTDEQAYHIEMRRRLNHRRRCKIGSIKKIVYLPTKLGRHCLLA